MIERKRPWCLNSDRFSEKASCLPRHDFSPPTSTTQCPPGWYWSARIMSCAPVNAEAFSSVTCGRHSVWSPSTLNLLHHHDVPRPHGIHPRPQGNHYVGTV
ncbi:hypothetical protein L210DRAFT_2945446 [Boletus edulis BED1]|uniref:Uncharacterized protein n=1 Tax=Boletus edulis BED1 TaxID=1328754 RepID=A0AAD4GIL0_BOLED|nr:hypothetical protein L210DRAFT_2945446 [Boletus edulis BED1]